MADPKKKTPKKQLEREIKAALERNAKAKIPAPRSTPYRLKLTPAELDAVEFARGRYGWADMLATHAAENGSIAFTESEM